MAPHLIGVLVGLSPRALGSIASHLDYRVLPIFRTFLGGILFSMLLFDMHADFFSEIDLQGNRFIRSAELFELSSILLLPRCLEASE